ncbi:MAG TPA: hypothetical protein VGQ90_09875 [Stellaceae bacterium]|nr:hypothetical protein [Stellaceae bacterium]
MEDVEMLRGEWGELALVSARLTELNQRRDAVGKLGNTARFKELAVEISVVQTRRDRLVERIMARLSEAA